MNPLDIARSRMSQHRLLTAATVILSVTLCFGMAAAADVPGLDWPWLGASGGQSANDHHAIEAAIGQFAAGMSSAGDLELCVGAGCAAWQGGVPAATAVPTPGSRSTIHLPILNSDG